REHGRIDDVAEQHREVPPLAAHQRTRRGLTWKILARRRRRFDKAAQRGALETGAAAAAEIALGRILCPAIGTAQQQCAAALGAEAPGVRVVRLAMTALHETQPRSRAIHRRGKVLLVIACVACEYWHGKYHNRVAAPSSGR